jgi:hypothetical protein
MRELEQLQNQLSALRLANLTHGGGVGDAQPSNDSPSPSPLLLLTNAAFSTETVATAAATKNDTKDTTKTKRTDRTATLSLSGGLLNDNDVLLLVSNKNRILCKFVPGTTFYFKKIRQHRVMYQRIANSERITNSDEKRIKLCEKVARSIWDHDGRFLKFDVESNSLSTISTGKAVMEQIEKDLIKAVSSQMKQRKRKTNFKKTLVDEGKSKNSRSWKKGVRSEKKNPPEQKKTIPKKKRTNRMNGKPKMVKMQS